MAAVRPAIVLLLLAGAAVLTIGSEAAVRGGVRLAMGRGVSPFFLGVALFGVDIGALAVFLVANGKGQQAIGAGAAFGSIAFVTSIALGVALLVSKRPVTAPPPAAILLPIGALVIGSLAVEDLQITRTEGIVLVAAYAVYVSILARAPREGSLQAARGEDLARAATDAPVRSPAWLLAATGVAVAYVGANLLVNGGVELLKSNGSLAEGFVGAAVVGSLTSAHCVLPQIRAVRTGEPSIALATLFGTVTAFTTGALGLAALIRPLVLDSSAAVAYIAASVPYCLLATVLLARGRAGRVTGAAMIVLYGGWLAIAWHL